MKFLNSQYKVQSQLAESKLTSERKRIEELLEFYGNTCSSTSGRGEEEENHINYARVYAHTYIFFEWI